MLPSGGMESVQRIVQAIRTSVHAGLFCKPPAESGWPPPPPIMGLVLGPSPPCLDSLWERISTGESADPIAAFLELRRVFLNALKFFCLPAFPGRIGALNCLRHADASFSGDAKLLEQHHAALGRPWMAPDAAFPEASMCIAVWEDFLAHNHTLYYHYDIAAYGPLPEGYDDVVSTRASMSDVSERLYSGSFQSVAQFRDHVSLVLRNVVAYWSTRGPEGATFVIAARTLLGAFEKLLDRAVAKAAAASRKKPTAAAARAASGPAASAMHATSAQPATIRLESISPVPLPPPLPVAAAAAAAVSPRGGGNMSKLTLDKCSRVLQKLCTKTFHSPLTNAEVMVAAYFMDPVSDEVAPGYSTVIRRPIWLRDVQRRLAEGEYASPAAMRMDVELITANCLEYNTDKVASADIRFLAVKLREEFLRLYSGAFPYEAAETAPPRGVIGISSAAVSSSSAAAPAPAPSKLKLHLGVKASTGVGLGAASSAAALGTFASAGHSSATTETAAGPQPPAESADGHAASNTVSCAPLLDLGAHAAILGPLLQMARSGGYEPPAITAAHVASRAADVVTRMMQPAALEDLRMVPPAWLGPRSLYAAGPTFEQAADAESDAEYRAREVNMNLAHNLVRAVKAHEWHGLFERRWLDVLPELYEHNAAAQRQRRGLLDVFELLRLQLPRKQNQADAARGVRSRPPGLVQDAYMNVGQVVEDLQRVFDAAIEAHSPPAWAGDPARGRDVVRKGRHLRALVDRFVHENLADSLPALAAARDAQRVELDEFVSVRPVIPATREILARQHRRLVAKTGPYARFHRWFLAPASEVWGALPADYAATVPRPMDLRTVGEKLARGAYATHGDYRDDLALIWANAIRYNEPKVLDRESQAVVADAKQMAAEMEVAWADAAVQLWDKLVCAQVEGEAAAAKVAAQRRREEDVDRQKAEYARMIEAQEAAGALSEAFRRLRGRADGSVAAAGDSVGSGAGACGGAGGTGSLLDLLPARERMLAHARGMCAGDPVALARELQAEGRRLADELPAQQELSRGLYAELQRLCADAALPTLSLAQQAGPRQLLPVECIIAASPPPAAARVGDSAMALDASPSLRGAGGAATAVGSKRARPSGSAAAAALWGGAEDSLPESAKGGIDDLALLHSGVQPPPPLPPPSANGAIDALGAFVAVPLGPAGGGRSASTPLLSVHVPKRSRLFAVPPSMFVQTAN